MATRNYEMTWSIAAGENLDNLTAGTGQIFKAVAGDDGKLANYGFEATGILCQVGKSGEHIGIVTSGITKYTAGAAVSVGDNLTVTTSGYIRKVKGGESIVGTALTAATSGSVATGLFNFAQQTFAQPAVDFTTTTNLSAAANLGKAVSATGDVAATSQAADGVLVTLPASGTTGKFQPFGIAQVCAGDVVTINRSLKVTTGGFFINADSGDLVVGRALAASAAGNSGQTFNAVVNFATPHYATSCLDICY